MTIRYKRTTTNKYLSYFFIIVGFTYFTLYIVNGLVFHRLIPIAIFNLVIGSLHFFIDRRDYIVIADDTLSIKANLFFTIKIPISSISNIYYDMDIICLDYGTKKKYLYLKFMDHKDIRNLEYFFRQNNLLMPTESFKTIQFNLANY